MKLEAVFWFDVGAQIIWHDGIRKIVDRFYNVGAESAHYKLEGISDWISEKTLKESNAMGQNKSTVETPEEQKPENKTFFIVRSDPGGGQRYSYTDRHTVEEAAGLAEKLAIETQKPVVIFQAIEVIKPVCSVEAIRLE